jgi:intracellular sulfur oxidation DsrE/DsrF family protein
VKLVWRPHWKRWFAIPALFVVALGIGGLVAEKLQTHVHRVVFQVNADDPVPMKHAVSNSINLVRHYRELNEPVMVEIVAYGNGITMFRADTSPVRDILEYMRSNFPEIAFTICGNTKAIIEQREGHAMLLIEGTRVVSFGIVRLVELQEAGWSYVRP